MARKESWSYNAGERGRSWVRAYEDGPGGVVLLEWFEPVTDEHGRIVTDPRTGKRATRRRRLSTGHRDRKRAMKQAEELAARFAEADPATAAHTLRRLLHLYLQEVTPRKSPRRRYYDRRAARMWTEWMDAQPERERRAARHPTTLDRLDWDRFVEARREGRVPGLNAARDNQVRRDLKFLMAVLSWAAGAQPGAPHHIPRNPWQQECRRSQGMEMPKERNPRRPSLTDEHMAALLRHAPDWRFALVLTLTRETIHRMNSVRMLRWEDVDLQRGLVRWREEYDKNRVGAVTVLTRGAVEALRNAPREEGSEWIVPAPSDPTSPVPVYTLHSWMRRAKRRAGVNVPGLGFHGNKRAGVRREDFRRLDDKHKEALTGTRAVMLRETYDEISLEEQRRVVAALEWSRSAA